MFRKTKLAAGLTLAFGGVLAIGAAPAAAQGSAQRIEITGSSIKRIDAETSLPVTIITRDDIARSGASNVQELIDRASYNNGGGRALGESIGESSAPGQAGASLRGLGRERTLILLNGRRLPAYPFSGLGVDLNAIPIAAVERIEILRDGASAVYGSDAIGGVMNFITRKDLQGGEVAVAYESPQKKGGAVASGSAGFGFGDLAKSGFNVLGTINFQKYVVIKSADREYSKTGRRPDLGIVIDSGNTFPANAFALGPTQYIPGVAGFPTCAEPASFGGAANCRYDFTSKIDIYPESERVGVLVRGTLQAGADNILFAEVIQSRNDLIFGLSQTPSVTTGKPGYLYPGGGKWYPTAAVDATRPGYRGNLRISWRMVDGGQRRTLVENEVTRFTVGAEGAMLGWDYKAGVMLNEGKAESSFLSGQFSDTRLRTALATGLVNPFGANDAEGLAELKKAELSGSERSSKTSNNGFDVQASRELFKLGGGMAAVALGFEARKEKYNDGYSALAGSGDIVGGSGNQGAVEGQRSVTGMFAEMTLPLMKGLEVSAAVRSDRYSKTSGSSRDGAFNSPNISATSPKISVRFQPMPEVLLRASVGRGFRMPALDNLYAPSSGTSTGGQYNDPFYDSLVGCAVTPDPNFCDAQLTAVNNSNPALNPEKSKTVSLGLVLEPMRDLTLGIDYFDIKIKNGITALTGDDILSDWFANQTGPTTSSSVYANRLVIDPDTGFLNFVNASLENVGQARVAGFDVSLKYRLRTSIGNFSPSYEATYLTKSTTTNIVTGAEGSNLGQYARGGPALRLKQNVGLEYETGPWTVGGRYYWQSSYVDYDPSGRVGTYELMDVQAAYRGIKGLTLTAGVRNLLDRDPPPTNQNDYFHVGLDPTYADMKGRTFYLRAAYKF